MVRVQQKMHAAEPQDQPDIPAFPAQRFYGLYAISPVTMLGCHRHPQGAHCALQEFSACIGAPGPRDFAVRTSAARRARIAPGDVRPSHPVSYVRDDRETPLMWERDSENFKCDLGSSRSDLFSHVGLDRALQKPSDLPVRQSHNASHFARFGANLKGGQSEACPPSSRANRAVGTARCASAHPTQPHG
jgi:hypothetical protein